MRTGTARTSYDWARGDRVTSVQRRELRLARGSSPRGPSAGADTAGKTERLRVRFAIAGRPPPRRIPLARLERSDPAWKPADIWYPGHMRVRSRQAVASGSGGRISVSSTPEGRKTTLAQAAEVSWDADLPRAAVRSREAGDSAWVEVSFDARPGRSYRFVQVVSAIASRESPYPLPRAVQEAALARERGYDSLAADNARAWARRWETDIEIEGDPELQRVVRSMLFYLLASADRGIGMGIPPMGLSSAGYYGHVFWDSDTWMFPPLLVTHPDVAHSLVAFRGRTLDAARDRAQANGFRGAMYPWEADERGRETTPQFAIQNANSEIHVTGDVALAQWQYYLATGDSAWLARDGYPVIRETANFWVSRSVYDSAADRYHIENVVSVHEGLIGVTDDAYTNAVARKNLEIATEASRRLGRPPDPTWNRVARRLHLPYDSASQFFRTYEGAPDSTLGAVTPLLAYPLGVPMSEQAKRAQLEQAVKRLLTEGPGAMMGSTILSVDAAELGDRAHARLAPGTQLPAPPEGPVPHAVGDADQRRRQFRDRRRRLPPAGDLRLDRPAARRQRSRPGLPRPAALAHQPARPPERAGARGKRYDVVVDSSGRRIIPRAATSSVGAGPERPTAGARVPGARRGRPGRLWGLPDPVLSRLEGQHGSDLPRAPRCTSGQPVRRRGEREHRVHRSRRPGPTRVAWRGREEAAQVADSGGMRSLQYTLAAGSPRVELGWFVLGSMRVERDFQYWRRHLEPFTAAAVPGRRRVACSSPTWRGFPPRSAQGTSTRWMPSASTSCVPACCPRFE